MANINDTPTYAQYVFSETIIKELEQISRPLNKSEMILWEINSMVIMNYIFNEYQNRGVI